MQKTMIKIRTWALLFATLCTVGAGVMLTSCQKAEPDTEVVLLSFGPMPVARGAELRFIGRNLDRVTAVVLPDNLTITAFDTKSAELLTVTVPQEAMPGYVVLKTPDGDITTKTRIGYSEPISVTTLSPATVKAGDELTITGDYLNLVGEVIFTDRVSVMKASFISQSRTQIKLLVPAAAQTGKIAVSDAEEDPVIVYSANSLTVKLPVFTSITPNPVKAGTALTITGTDLDLVTSVVLGGNKTLTTFTSQSATQIVLTVPADTKDGKVTMIPASGVRIASAEDLVMVVPTVSVTPVTLKNGQDITVTGTNLDLIDRVIFGGNKQGTIIAGGTATEIHVTVPDDAVTGQVKFITRAEKEVSGPNLTMIDPVLLSFSPVSAKPNTDIEITGTDLDLVVEVVFEGDIKGNIGTRSETAMSVTIPVGAKTGKVKLVTKNGSTVQSAIDLTVLSNLPNFTGYTESKGVPGQILTLNGTNMLLIKELIFPGNILATAYGVKTDTRVEVYVPENVAGGYGQITMVTYEGEQGLLPSIFFGGTDPITAQTIMITNFNGGGATQSTWGGVVTFGLPSVPFDGTAAMLGLTGSGWQWTWAQNWDNNCRPPLANPENYVLKMDICITTPAPGVEAGICLKGWTTAPYLGNIFQTSTGGNWVTLTFDVLTAGMSIDGTGDWGIWINGSAYDLRGVMVDNLRFDPK
ncbi:MAG: glycan-binding surface protein [Bacteroidales bacterium]